jgi:tartrate dehydratase alpha subunit/fumarate hydratase class I-like protein
MFNFKTVDGILKNFNKAVKDLEEVAEREVQNAEYWIHQEKQAALFAIRANEEAKRAKKAANKIKEFLA